MKHEHDQTGAILGSIFFSFFNVIVTCYLPLYIYMMITLNVKRQNRPNLLLFDIHIKS